MEGEIGEEAEIMRADICDSSDEAAVARFRETLKRLGASLLKKDWSVYGDHYQFVIGDESLSIFSDEWSTDIEGSDSLVRHVLSEYQKQNTPKG